MDIFLAIGSFGVGYFFRVLLEYLSTEHTQFVEPAKKVRTHKNSDGGAQFVEAVTPLQKFTKAQTVDDLLQ